MKQRTIQKMVRPSDVPKGSEKQRATDRKRLAGIQATKESWNALRKKLRDIAGNLPVALK